MSTKVNPTLESTTPNELRNEIDLIAENLSLDGANILELGCGEANLTRQIVERFPNLQQITATDVNQAQLDKNAADASQNGGSDKIVFKYGSAQKIDMSDDSVDVVFAFKSLHHVPQDLLEQALKEIARVLKPGGKAWISEPVFVGDFMKIIMLARKEQPSKSDAFQALKDAAESGLLRWCNEIHCNIEFCFANFEEFAQKANISTHKQTHDHNYHNQHSHDHQHEQEHHEQKQEHREHKQHHDNHENHHNHQHHHDHHYVDAKDMDEIKKVFEKYTTTDGAHFEMPIRIDIMQKP